MRAVLAAFEVTMNLVMAFKISQGCQQKSPSPSLFGSMLCCNLKMGVLASCILWLWWISYQGRVCLEAFFAKSRACHRILRQPSWKRSVQKCWCLGPARLYESSRIPLPISTCTHARTHMHTHVCRQTHVRTHACFQTTSARLLHVDVVISNFKMWRKRHCWTIELCSAVYIDDFDCF